jgi:microcystin-dependent protein
MVGERKLINSTKPQFQPQVPIASDYFLPNHSGIATHPEFQKALLYLLPTGSIIMWGGTVASVPAGWLFCDGSAVSRTTYANLFSAIGTIYGVGNGTTTFNIPNMRNRFPAGAQQDSGGIPSVNLEGYLAQIGGQTTTTVEGTTDPGISTYKIVEAGSTLNVPEGIHTHSFFVEDVYIVNPYTALAFMIKT